MRAPAALADVAPACPDRSKGGAKGGPGLGLPSAQNVGRSTVTLGGYLKSFSLWGRPMESGMVEQTVRCPGVDNSVVFRRLAP